jgi:O-antigen biosynthesis protein
MAMNLLSCRAPLRRWGQKGVIVAHLLRHGLSFVRFLLAHPQYLVSAVRLCLTHLRCLGFRPLGQRISWRLGMLLSIPERPDCPVCAWIGQLRHNAALRGRDPRAWFAHFRPGKELLARFRARRWPAHAPTFSVLMPVFNPPADWLSQAIQSVRDQTYGKWELLCVNDGSTAGHVRPLLDDAARSDGRIRVIHRDTNQGVSAASNAGLQAARGEYVCFLDHDDALEPQALHRFADAILSDQPDLLYSDEAITRADLDEVISVVARPQFSYDYYLSHPYFVHLVTVRTALARAIGGFDEAMPISQDVDFVLRVLESAQTVTHVPDVLYRWRTTQQSLGHLREKEVDAISTAALRRHLQRLGMDADVRVPAPNFRDVCFRSVVRPRVAIVIPTRNQGRLLRNCVDSLEQTVHGATADIVIVNHQSDEPETLAYLAELNRRHRVIDFTGPFNFSVMMNQAVRQVAERPSHYLFLNNDTEALQVGWLEHMLGLGCRDDVAVVGAMLLYPDTSIQHAGVVIGMRWLAEHAHKFEPFYRTDGRRLLGYNGSLLANRDCSAVTGACLLVRASVFEQLDGFDPSLAIGFGDTDLCIRAVRAGYKVLLDAQAILFHHESMSRGKVTYDPHPTDSRAFLLRYRELVRAGDPFYSPLLSVTSTGYELNGAVRAPYHVQHRTIPVVLPAIEGAPSQRPTLERTDVLPLAQQRRAA